MYKLYLHGISGLPQNLAPYVEIFTSGFEKYFIGRTNPSEGGESSAFFDKNHAFPYKFPMIRAENLIFSVYSKRNIFSDLLIGTIIFPFANVKINEETKVEIQSNLKSGDVYTLSFFVESPKEFFPLLAYKSYPNFIQFEDNSILSRDVYAYLTFMPPIQDYEAQTVKFEAIELISPTGEYDICSPIKPLYNIEISHKASYVASTGLTRLMHMKTEQNRPHFSYGYKKEGTLFVCPYIINEGNYTGTVIINLLSCTKKGKYYEKKDYYDSTKDYENKFILLAQIPIIVKGPGFFSPPRAVNLDDLSLKQIQAIGAYDVKQGIHQLALQINSPNEIVTSRIISTNDRPVSLSEALFLHNIPYPSQLRFELVWEGESDIVLMVQPKDQYQVIIEKDKKWIETYGDFHKKDKSKTKSNKDQTRKMDGEGSLILLNAIPDHVSYIEFIVHHKYDIAKTESLGFSLRADNRELTYTPLSDDANDITIGRLQRNQHNLWDYIPFFTPL